MTTGDAYVEIDWRTIPASTGYSTSDLTAARISPYGRHLTGCLKGRMFAVSILWNVRLVVLT